MKITAPGLATHLARKAEPLVLIRGDDPLLCEEAAAVVRAAVLAGSGESRRTTVDQHFDWKAFYAEMHAPSLFSPRTLHELRFHGGRVGAVGGEILEQLCEAPAPHALLLVIAIGLERSVFESAWARAFEHHGLVVGVDRPEGRALQAWIRARMEARGLKPDAMAVERLAYCLEGNFLALAQEIDKLVVLRGDGGVTEEDLDDLLTDGSRFSVYAWVDACAAGTLAPALRILARLRDEGTEPILILWAVVREIRGLLQMATEREKGVALDRVLAEKKVWSRRRPVVSLALKRLSAGALMTLLQQAARVDRIAKGRAEGAVWPELERLALRFCS